MHGTAGRTRCRCDPFPALAHPFRPGQHRAEGSAW
ncbi:hypothetical protein Ae168Ps1_5786 [Pseudonocardia sp. Ae168_Ps1]|nr:hypothetical protein Ae168Ps1_5786 [Pseudonocardia sp. Ae168_Ps1]